MTIDEVRIGDRIIDPKAKASPANGYEVIGIDRVGNKKYGPCVVCDWDTRGVAEFAIVKASELVSYRFVRADTPNKALFHG